MEEELLQERLESFEATEILGPDPATGSVHSYISYNVKVGSVNGNH